MIGGARNRLIILGGGERLRLDHQSRGVYYVFKETDRVRLGMIGVASRFRHEGVDGNHRHWGHWGWRNGKGGCFTSLEQAARDLVEL